MDSECQECGSRPATADCSQHSPAIPLCQTCVSTHAQKHKRSSVNLSSPVTLPDLRKNGCFSCVNPGIKFCLDSGVCVCAEHENLHKVMCTSCDLYPVKQLAVVQNSNGKELLRRGKVIDEAAEHLSVLVFELEEKLIDASEREFVEVVAVLTEAKRRCQVEIKAKVQALRQEFEAYMTRLHDLKFNENLTPGNKLEALVLNNSSEDFRLKIGEVTWFRVSTNKSVLETVSSGLFKLQRCEELLEDLDTNCTWANQYLMVPGPTSTHFFGLESQKMCSGKASVPMGDGLAWINLPDGRICTVGNDQEEMVSMVDKNYITYRHVAKLKTGRSCSGLAYCNKQLYIFGGSNGRTILNSVESFDTKTADCSLLPSKMCSARHGFCPCVWNSKVLIAGGISTGNIEIFDPETEEFHLTSGMINPGPTLAIAFSIDEVLFLNQRVISYFPKQGILEVLESQESVFKVQAHPIYQTEAVFFLMNGVDGVIDVGSISLLTYQLEHVHSV